VNIDVAADDPEVGIEPGSPAGDPGRDGETLESRVERVLEELAPMHRLHARIQLDMDDRDPRSSAEELSQAHGATLGGLG